MPRISETMIRLFFTKYSEAWANTTIVANSSCCYIPKMITSKLLLVNMSWAAKYVLLCSRMHMQNSYYLPVAERVGAWLCQDLIITSSRWPRHINNLLILIFSYPTPFKVSYSSTYFNFLLLDYAVVSAQIQ